MMNQYALRLVPELNLWLIKFLPTDETNFFQINLCDVLAYRKP